MSVWHRTVGYAEHIYLLVIALNVKGGYSRWLRLAINALWLPETTNFTLLSGQLSRYRHSLRAGQYGNRIPVWGEIFNAGPERPWSPSSHLCNGYRVYYPEVKWSRRGVGNPPHLAMMLKKQYSSTAIFLLYRCALIACFRVIFIVAPCILIRT
jgi:hypothetical protein